MKIVIFGATGSAGSEVVRQAIADTEIEQITVVVRKPLDFGNSKVQTILLDDFLNYNGLLSVFREAHACIWCLGISQTRVSKVEYFIITYDYALAAANAMLSVNPEISFVFLSGHGADSTEKSRILFASVKGKTENALNALPFKHLYILRPTVIVPVVKPENHLFLKQVEFLLSKLIGVLLPKLSISTVQLAKAILVLVKRRDPSVLLENKQIKDGY